jgi:glycerate dehydrogenase
MSKSKDKIVFLDAGTVDYSDVSLREFESLGNFKAYHQTAAKELKTRASEATILITNKFGLDRERITQLPNLRSICIAATGVNVVDLEAARANKIAVTNVAGYSTETVVQFTIAFLLALANNLVKYNQDAHDGTWSKSPFFMHAEHRIQEVFGKTLGIIGYGNIGSRVAEIARALGMKVLISEIPGRQYSKSGKIKRTPFKDVIAQSDFLTIHAPLTDLTRNLIDGPVIRKMKKGSALINMARGGIVNEEALREALESGHLSGAAADVLSAEPPPENHILLHAPNLLLTPHVAWASREARTRLISEIAKNIKAFQSGKKRNRII